MKEQNGENLERGRSRKNSSGLKKRRSRIISLAAVGAAAIVIVSAVVALWGRDTYELKEPAYMCVNGSRFDLKGDVRLYHKNDRTTLNAFGEKYEMEDYPLILTDSGAVLLQKSCSWTRAADEMIFRVDYFSEVGKDEEGMYIGRRGKKSRDLSGFLYDNSDTYVFLEPATLSYNDKTVEIEPMTVVQVVYRDYIQIYGPGLENETEDLDSDAVTAVFENEKRVNLATDRYYAVNGSWRLLFLPLDVLQAAE